jgi:hypothetical protein
MFLGVRLARIKPHAAIADREDEPAVDVGYVDAQIATATVPKSIRQGFLYQPIQRDLHRPRCFNLVA